MIRIEPCQPAHQAGWLSLRQALWPDCPAEEHLEEIASLLDDPQRYINLLAYTADGQPVGLAEASLRRDYVNGTEHSPVVFLEGLYVSAEQRRQGIAEQLIDAVAQWGRDQGCVEMASDTGLENLLSQTVHKALGFEETERVVYFRKSL
ncbi:aminoglycoside 6'-N-acetyltransferase [Pseudomonas chlororaphis]|uniref:Aminoglycoside N(6')-acetyltransferase type 1 n=1 Tax=Pseudomonas chlororaphis TaxID=587753 RepID=A0AAX3FX67_9PSED|nr:aminoglycoside 6'-N-acetyltransferase [Pseudomonas chlororaphis]AZC40480.1 Aminoglycoside N(6')-acetyltransferase [Pseudomonas chlororaphis subsp. piscium]AZC47038.1 Aminoglycoside N(6')-acetyltransferase [Pseudomonas chlororaphis subsp. piscium]WDG72517.1 GNAT family N-acetyltransferase [Pseudomonas chlororaphis]WDH29697.1 GNAT family N-acetyltransferase [Pseudomonas chlororaphis]WDH71039.1 GNAT family N-acetyltransferase [Pseudomonas chlororaphis]